MRCGADRNFGTLDFLFFQPVYLKYNRFRSRIGATIRNVLDIFWGFRMRLKTYLLATASSIGFVGVAAAADLVPKMPLPTLPVADWTGYYIGINGGVGRADWGMTQDDEGSGISGSRTGGVAGGQVGYNLQIKHWVYGLEADADWTGLRQTMLSGTGVPLPSATISNVNWLASVRGRAGVALDDTMLYMTGGLALGGVQNGWGFGYGVPASACCDISKTETRVGWVVGGGVEHMLTQNWSIRAEALYYDLGSSFVSGVAPDGVIVSMNASNEVIVGRLGLNLKW